MKPERRTDIVTAIAINRALEIDEEEGAIAAWVYLTRCGIPLKTMERVLIANATTGARRS